MVEPEVCEVKRVVIDELFLETCLRELCHEHFRVADGGVRNWVYEVVIEGAWCMFLVPCMV